MWYFNSQIIKTPKTMVIDDITHPKEIFRDSAMLTSLGIKSYREVTPDSRYYTNGAYTVDTSGAEVVGTHAGVAIDLATLKAKMLGVINSEVDDKQSFIDWYWSRADKGGTAVPANIATYATTIYSEQVTKEGEVNAMTTLDEIMEYENRPYTEVRKTGVGDETESSTREINMLQHWTEHPDAPADAGLVSLTAD